MLRRLLIAAFFLIPLAWLVSLAVRTPQEIFFGASRFIPENPTLANFGQVLTDTGFLTYLWNGAETVWPRRAGSHPRRCPRRLCVFATELSRPIED